LINLQVEGACNIMRRGISHSKNYIKAVKIYNRYSGQIEEEPICGEIFMRIAYGTFPGRMMQTLLFSRPIFSKLATCYANRRRSVKRILPFVKKYGIDVGDSLLSLDQFKTFNEFFCRKLKTESRPICSARDAIIAPADGRYFLISNISRETKISAKGRVLNLDKLLGNTSLAAKFCGGCAVIARLCPFDYHRFHFPYDGVPGTANFVAGPLHSVHPLALQRIASLNTNKRFLTRMVVAFGEIAIIEVGATFVGSITQTYTANKYAKKGSEKGFFSLGGSTIIILFERGVVSPRDDLKRWSISGTEVYVRMGDSIMWCK
jgi:phosphatidylserine decarboxylase